MKSLRWCLVLRPASGSWILLSLPLSLPLSLSPLCPFNRGKRHGGDPTGGHDVARNVPGTFEEIVRFVLADLAMVYAQDHLFPEIVVNPYLLGDRAFVLYRRLGEVLSEVERSERRLRPCDYGFGGCRHISW